MEVDLLALEDICTAEANLSKLPTIGVNLHGRGYVFHSDWSKMLNLERKNCQVIAYPGSIVFTRKIFDQEELHGEASGTPR